MPTDHSTEAIPTVKNAATSPEVIPPIRNRWSPRAFLDKPIPAEALRTILEAARWSASCFNEQPWRYLVATKANPAEFEKLLSTLVEKNQAWAKAAPVLIISVGKRTFTHNSKPNRYHLHDVGAASAVLAIQAAAMGMAVHAMGGFDAEKARALFGIPEDFEPAAAIALGYAAPAQAAPAEFQSGETAPRARKGLSELIYSGNWGTPASL